MRVKFEGEVREFPRRMRVKDILDQLHLNREEVMVIKEEELITEDEWVEEDEEIEIWRVVSGG